MRCYRTHSRPVLCFFGCMFATGRTGPDTSAWNKPQTTQLLVKGTTALHTYPNTVPYPCNDVVSKQMPQAVTDRVMATFPSVLHGCRILYCIVLHCTVPRYHCAIHYVSTCYMPTKFFVFFPKMVLSCSLFLPSAFALEIATNT